MALDFSNLRRCPDTTFFAHFYDRLVFTINKKLAGNLMLLLTAFIWGSAFVAQSLGMELIGPFTFNGVRNVIGGLALLPVVFLLRRGRPAPDAGTRRQTWIGGLCCGAVLFVASSFQQFGILYTSVGKAGFITALYIVLVPLFGLFFGRRVRAAVWLAVGLAVVGLYLLCFPAGGFTLAMERGDLLVLCCAFLFTGHILVIAHFAPRADSVMMSCIQFFVAGLLSTVAMLLFEAPNPRDILSSWGPLLYAGVLSSGVAYTLQIVAQKNTNPAVASLLMSLEAVFALLSGWVILGDSFSGREIFGAALMFGAILLAQVPDMLGRKA